MENPKWIFTGNYSGFIRVKKNASAFRFKRKYVLLETQVHFNQNASTFSFKRKYVFQEEFKRFD